MIERRISRWCRERFRDREIDRGSHCSTRFGKHFRSGSRSGQDLSLIPPSESIFDSKVISPLLGGRCLYSFSFSFSISLALILLAHFMDSLLFFLHSSQHSDGVNQVLLRPQISVPKEDQDRSHPLSHYWISSSHNTYLTAKQLYGGASTMTYQHTLSSGARCVEIDVWDNEQDEASPKVTHGFTL